MNWLLVIANKLKILSFIIFITGLCIGTTSAELPAIPESVRIPSLSNIDLESQIGFYDLLSEKDEVYNIRLYSGIQNLLVSITKPTDERFIFKGKMILDEENHDDEYPDFTFTPLYYYSPEHDELINSVMDFSKQRNLALSSYAVETNQLIVSQNGLLFVYPNSVVQDKISNVNGSPISMIPAPKNTTAKRSFWFF
ncbi:hypothetical protein I2492_02715 [Budviciaceae bacterium CWB-B4]|uniref:Uncharacterized protein n=1 Tax=Limnobaculum xujianqingii TaxID=2738837 RepID=A0A9D7AFV1_9GAMM|nr:hypothetical protein [Limnobaculum xujianqingii]MBK5071929.1 hypothetical protein [Limnobaculum xujianqingii]MBK5175238.1 hypothetical protein [Limnobaculum xujianqingii]